MKSMLPSAIRLSTCSALPVAILTFCSVVGASLNSSAAPTSAGASTPVFASAAIAREWADAQASAGRYDLAARGYLQEAALRVKLGDPEGAEVERRKAWSLQTDISIGVPTSVLSPDQTGLAKLEPAAGCLIGTLDTPSEGRTFDGESVADDFAQRIGKPVAVAFRYIRYGDSFPFAWAYHQAKEGRAIELAMEPSDIYAVSDDEYLEGFAADLKQSRASCFLRFGGEMNGSWAPWGKDPEAYRHAFRTVHDVMAQFAPSCAMVWAPNMMPLDDIDKYYPGDDVVDWVGLSLYLVKYHDDQKSEPAWQDSPEVYIDPFYKKYCERKPMCLVECGVTREAHADGQPCDQFAAARIEDLMSAIKLRYPRLKMMCWFDRNNLNGEDVDRRLNDYSLPPGSAALQAFKTAVSDPYFLSTMPDATDQLTSYQTLADRLPDGYSGPVAISLITYSLNPTLVVTRGGQSETLSRPFMFDMPRGSGPVTVQIKDDAGRVARTVTLAAPGGSEVASSN
jgi:hypothetical protein